MSDPHAPDVYPSPSARPPMSAASFVVDRRTAFTVRTAAFRLGIDGPVYAHVDLVADQHRFRLHLYDDAALRLLTAALCRLVHDQVVILAAATTAYPAPRTRTFTTSPLRR